MSCYVAGYRGLGADAVTIATNAPPLPDYIVNQFQNQNKGESDEALQAQYAHYLKMQAEIPADRGGGPPLSFEAWKKARVAIMYSASPITPSLTPAQESGVTAPPGQRFTLPSIPWWGWAIAGVVAWQFLGARR